MNVPRSIAEQCRAHGARLARLFEMDSRLSVPGDGCRSLANAWSRWMKTRTPTNEVQDRYETVSDRNLIPAIRDFKPFLGYGPEDFEAAKLFYKDIGFEKLWDGGEACCFDTGIGHRFLVTLHHGLDRSSAGMMHLWVESVDSWYDYLRPKQLEEKFPGVRIAEPAVAEWGWRILHVWDPGGWLLHIAEPHSDENKAFFNSVPWIAK